MPDGSSSIVPPVIVAEGWDATFHRTVNHVVAYYEPWFAADADCQAFDSQGRRLELVADPPVERGHLVGQLWTDTAHRSSLLVRALETEPGGAEELADLLRGWLGRVDALREVTATASLPDLLAMAIDYARRGKTPRRRGRRRA